MDHDPRSLPWATLRLTDDGEPHGQVVEVLVNDRPVAQLIACRVGYDLTLSGRGVLNVGVPVKHPVELETTNPGT